MGRYNELLTADPTDFAARLNIAALHHGYGNLEDALTQCVHARTGARQPPSPPPPAGTAAHDPRVA